MRKIIRKVLSTGTFKDAGFMSLATGVAAVLAAFFFILVARLMGPEKLGMFSLATAASFMLADMFDIAINTSLVRFVAGKLDREPKEADRYLKLIFKLKIWIGLSITIIIGLFASPFSRLVLGQSLPVVAFFIGGGTAVLMLYSFSTYHLQARKKFLKAAIGIILLPSFRLVAFLLLFFLGNLNLISILSAYFFTVPLATLITMSFAPRTFLTVKGENAVANSFLRYNVPITIGFGLAAVSGRIDNFILGNLAGSLAVGFYSAAFRLFTPLQFFAGSISTVFAPRFASFSDKQKAKTYFFKALAIVSFLSMGMLLFLPLSPVFIHLFYGTEFEPSVAVLKILFLGFTALLWQAPFTSIILYYYSKAKLFTVVCLIQLVTVILANLILVDRYQEIGSAIAFVITQFLVLFMLIVYTIKKLREEE